MNNSQNSPLDTNSFPRTTNRLLSQAEKTFLDSAPAEVVKACLEFDDGDLDLRTLNSSGVEAHRFYGERAVAVRDYYQMLFAVGVMKDPRDG